MVINVYVSAATQDNISRFEFLDWVNSTLKANFSKIEEMSTGAAYCQLTHLLFRDSINLRKVIWNSRNEMDRLNLRRLRKGLRQRRNECYPVCPLPAGATGPTPSRPPSARTSKTTTTTSGVRAEKTSSNPTAPAYYRPFSVESSAMKALEVEISRLSKRYSEAIFAEIAQTMKEERDSYLGRLRKIEELCNTCAEGEDVRKDDILAILYEESGNGEGGDGQIAAVNNDDTFVSCSSKRSL
ncbi:hypothetical protein Q1695_010900 [Nippostrongylus brasiliensis]|nr:hypothetical protein Q1695_010900 [Nippostrongylus brasiliensis]